MTSHPLRIIDSPCLHFTKQFLTSLETSILHMEEFKPLIEDTSLIFFWPAASMTYSLIFLQNVVSTMPRSVTKLQQPTTADLSFRAHGPRLTHFCCRIIDSSSWTTTKDSSTRAYTWQTECMRHSRPITPASNAETDSTISLGSLETECSILFGNRDLWPCQVLMIFSFKDRMQHIQTSRTRNASSWNSVRCTKLSLVIWLLRKFFCSKTCSGRHWLMSPEDRSPFLFRMVLHTWMKTDGPKLPWSMSLRICELSLPLRVDLTCNLCFHMMNSHFICSARSPQVVFRLATRSVALSGVNSIAMDTPQARPTVRSLRSSQLCE